MRAWFLLALAAPALLAAEEPRERYQPIIDAKPFGDMSDLAAVSAAQAEEQQQKEEIAKAFRMCGITDMPDGSRKIAFLDETAGAAASYLLAVGETQNGFTLLSADYDAERATLSKDGLTFTLGLGKGLIDDAPQAAADKAPAPAPAAAPPAPAKGSFRERLLLREAAKAQDAANRRKAIGDEIAAEAAKTLEAKTQAAARRLQIERIKQGLPPTRPITLTPEEDAELEAAGVFRQPRQPEERQDAQAQPQQQPDSPAGDPNDHDEEALPPANP